MPNSKEVLIPIFLVAGALVVSPRFINAAYDPDRDESGEVQVIDVKRLQDVLTELTVDMKKIEESSTLSRRKVQVMNEFEDYLKEDSDVLYQDATIGKTPIEILLSSSKSSSGFIDYALEQIDQKLDQRINDGLITKSKAAELKGQSSEKLANFLITPLAASK